MKHFELMIFDGGLAAACVSTSYREAAGEGETALLSKDAVPTYHRGRVNRLIEARAPMPFKLDNERAVAASGR